MHRCNPQASERTLCVLLTRMLRYSLLVAGHDAGEGVLTREQVQELVPQARAQLPMLPGLPGLSCAKFEARPSGSASVEEEEPVAKEL